MTTDWNETAKRLLPCYRYMTHRCNPEVEGLCIVCEKVPAVAAKLAEVEAKGAKGPWRNCPRCDSPNPHLHPAVQHEGEVQICSHPFHASHALAEKDAMIARLQVELVNKKTQLENAYQEMRRSDEFARTVCADRDVLRARLAETERDRKGYELERNFYIERCHIENEHVTELIVLVDSLKAEHDAAQAKGRREGLREARQETPYHENLLHGDKKDTCVYLKNGEKIVIKRELGGAGNVRRVWLEIVPQDTIHAAEIAKAGGGA